MAKSPHSDKYIFYTNRKKSKFSWQFLLKCLLIISFIFCFILFSTKLYANSFAELTSSKLYLGSGINTSEAITLNSKVHFDINGPVITTELTQSFYNQSDEVLTGTYAFPLPINAAVNHLKIVIGERVIEGQIMEKQQAIKTFKKALASGKKASLVTQQKANIFKNKIANIDAHETISVTLTYVQLADYENDTFSFRFPMTFTPQYSPMKVNTDREGLSIYSAKKHGRSNDTHQLSATQKNTISISANINAGVPLQSITSSSHDVSQEEALNANQHTVHKVAITNTYMDKDFELSWQPISSNDPLLATFNQKVANEEYQLIMMLPPSVEKAEVLPRNVIFVLDKSGSMQGQSIKQAKSSLIHALSSLTPQDSFNIIAFESNSDQLFDQNVLATRENIATAKHFIKQVNAEGGTEMAKPLTQALKVSSTNIAQHATSQVVFITDGAISNELELFQIINKYRTGQRIFTIGIGSAPNSFFMRKAAQFGQGKTINISNIANVKSKIDTFMTSISQPVMTNINIASSSEEAIEIYPAQIPDLFIGQPLVVNIKSPNGKNLIHVKGQRNENLWTKVINTKELTSNARGNNSNTSTLWAKAKIADLLDQKYLGGNPELINNQILNTSINHKVLSPLTAFIAVEKSASTSPALQQAKIKNMAPAGAAIPFPQTATNWQTSLLIGLLLMLGWHRQTRKSHP